MLSLATLCIETEKFLSYSSDSIVFVKAFSQRPLPLYHLLYSRVESIYCAQAFILPNLQFYLIAASNSMQPLILCSFSLFLTSYHLV